jgi:hypothetical protein
MATEDKEQVLVAMEGEIGSFERLIEFAKECGFKTLLAADERSATLIRDPIVHIPHLSRLVTVGPQAGPTGRVHMVGCSNRSSPSHQQISVVSGYYSIFS